MVSKPESQQQMPLSLGLKGEDLIQSEIVRWLYKESKDIPELWLFHHIPNGGWRGMQAGMRFKSLGVRSGVPDISIPIKRGYYHGLWLEIKDGKKGVVSDNQKEWHARLTEAGHFVAVIRTAEEGIETIKWYLNL